jgi:hypothetical protein
MVSAPFASGPTVYVFTQQGTGWFQTATILPPDYWNNFALDGNTVVTSGLTSASIYAGSGNTWTSQAKVQPSDYTPSLSTDLFFGGPVALSGDTALIGAEPLDSNGQSAHWAYVFVRSGSTWTQQAKLVPSGLADNGSPHFQMWVGISGNTAVLATSSGAYVFVRSGTSWTQTQLVAPPINDGFFASAVALSGNAMVVGAATFNGTGGESYVFGSSGGTWIVGPTLTSSAAGGDTFGSSVAISGAVKVIGAPFANVSAPGAVYVYSCSP